MILPSKLLGRNMSIFDKISVNCFDAGVALLEPIVNLNSLLLFSITAMMVLLWLIGGRLSKFNKPESLLLSPVIRNVASVLSIFGQVLICLGFTYLVLAFMFVEVRYVYIGFGNNKGLYKSIFLGANDLWSATNKSCASVLGGLFFGAVISTLTVTRFIPQWERGEGLHDIDDYMAKFKTLEGFNPIIYINIEKGCFVGLDLNKQPIYVPWIKLRETHIQVLGATGTGKGVLMTLIASQCILAGESVIWFDPKLDRFSPKIMRMAAKKVGKKFYMINLNPEQPPQFNLLQDTKAHEIEELLVAGFDLIGKGTDGDFHRGKDEDAAILAARLAVDNNACSIPALIGQCLEFNEITKQENFWRKLNKLSGLGAINTSSGLNLIDAIKSKAVIYIVGSTDNERVKMLQKMLLIRVMQIIKKQDRSKEKITTCVVLDEFKHILSPTALTGLGVVRDFNSHFLLAHQSLGDLDSCTGITRAEAEGAVLDNTAIKFIYKLGDADHAEKLSKISGKRSIFVEQVSKVVDDNNSESGGWRETHVPLIDVDVITHLPMPSDRDNQPSTGVLFGVGKAKIFYVHHIKVSGDMPVPMAAPEYISGAAANAGDLI